VYHVRMFSMNTSKILGIVLVLLIVGFAMASVVTKNKESSGSSPNESAEDTLGSYNEGVEEIPSNEVETEDFTQDLAKESKNLDLEKEKKMSYTVTLKTTEGDIVIKLSEDETPVAVSNFVKLSKEGFYDGVIFHRVVEGFMIQGGDPKGDGTGGPGYKFDDEPFTGEYVRGAVAMANSGPNTNGSQFFIMHQNYPLDRDYVIFGQVLDGLDVVDKIATAETTMSPSGKNSKPVNPVVIESTEILEE